MELQKTVQVQVMILKEAEITKSKVNFINFNAQLCTISYSVEKKSEEGECKLEDNLSKRKLDIIDLED